MSDPDVVVVGGGHNGLVAAAYLARAGLSVRVLERRSEVGGAAVSYRAFPGVDVRLSRYSYLVSLLPQRIVDDLGLRLTLRKRRFGWYTPVRRDGRSTGLLVDNADPARTKASFAAVTGSDADFAAWQDFSARMERLAERVFPTLTGPLPSRDELRALVDGQTWREVFAEPLGHALESTFANDAVRGTLLTDGLISTFASADDPSLRQNRCFLYHVIGNGTGEWRVPVGGMGAVTVALRDAAERAGADVVTGAEVTSIDPDGEVRYVHDDVERTVRAEHVLANIAPSRLAALLGESHDETEPEGAQLKVNMVLRRLPRLADPDVTPEEAFSGTLHVSEGYQQLATAYAEASAGRVPSLPPCEVYCHSLTDPSILGPAERAAGVHTLTLFGLHMPARLFRSSGDVGGAGSNAAARDAALVATLASLNEVLAEPIEDCLLTDVDGRPCLEAKTPVDLERELGLPGGHIFHGDLAWPFVPDGSTDAPDDVWGVATAHPRILRCGAGAMRGGGVSGIGGHNAAMAVLTGRTAD
ncbi:MAG: FAD-dependent oxidoreductase [Actinophytocola sp.]|nr:FAD-dependent oxidoreductase [Actinophytocola sp.]